MKKNILNNGILKFQNEQSILYIKPSNKFFNSDHSPSKCWKGSGYKMMGEKIITYKGKEYIYAKLKKNKETFHTICFYQSIEHQTISQWKWRWNNLKEQKEYRLINITCTNEETLYKEIDLEKWKLKY